MSKLPGCFSMCWRIPILPILFPPTIKTEAPFSNLMRPSTSPVSKLSCNINFSLKIFKNEMNHYLDTVVLLDVWVRVSDGSAIMSDDVGNLVGT
jgi:hypothetical protein